jgi:hypothetical protein
MIGSIPVYKSRSLGDGISPWSYKYTPPGGYTHTGNDTYRRKMEWMLSYNNPGWKLPAWFRREKLPYYDIGSPWLKYDIILNPPKAPVNTAWYFSGSYGFESSVAYVGSGSIKDCHEHILNANAQADQTWFAGKCPAKMSDNDMDQFGSLAILITSPTNPAADLSTALGELIHDGLPSMPGKAEGNIGDEYLNLQFGWSPTISDGESFIKAIRNSDEIISQYLRDNGKLIRRHFGTPPKETRTSTVTANAPPYFLSNGTDIPTGQEVPLGTMETVTYTKQTTWFDGVFIYHLPEEAFGRRISELDKTYGLVPDINTAWQLTPWSWLVDWFSNAGVVIKNMAAFNTAGLVMPWGYVMNDIIQTVDYRWSGNIRINNVPTPYTFVDSITTRTRQRRQATPFGFGLTWDGFSPFQLSILAALGISRV